MLLRMISERCANAGSILDHFVLLHPDIELLDFSNPKVLKMVRRLFESCFRGIFPRIRAATDQTDDFIQTYLTASFLSVRNWPSSRRSVISHVNTPRE